MRKRLRKRSTNLKIEGEFFHITEHADKFIKYLLEKRAELLRKPTTLKLEGEMDTKTETSEKYIKYEAFERPLLCKKFTQLRLEGELDITTEKREKFVPFNVQKRPPLVKKSTNLHLEGDITLIPEYRQEYVAYGSLERPKPVIPINHLKPGCVFENINHERKPSDDRLHPAIPFLRDSDKKPFEDSPSRRTPARSREHSFVKSSDHQPVSSRQTPLYPNIIFTKASDSDISRSSMMMDSGYQTQERAKPRRSIQRQSDIDIDREKESPKRMYVRPHSAVIQVDSPKHTSTVVTPIYYFKQNEEVR